MGTTNVCHCWNCPLQYTEKCVVWTKFTAALEREKVLEYALERARYDLDGIGDYGSPLLSVERIDEALTRVKAMREGK